MLTVFRLRHSSSTLRTPPTSVTYRRFYLHALAALMRAAQTAARPVARAKQRAKLLLAVRYSTKKRSLTTSVSTTRIYSDRWPRALPKVAPSYPEAQQARMRRTLRSPAIPATIAWPCGRT
eukprot:IDg19843t1